MIVKNSEGVSTIYDRRRMPTVAVGVALPLLSRDRPFGNAREGREERPSPMVANVRDEESRLLSWGVASPPFSCARQFGNALGDEGRSDHHRRSNISERE